jgi:hypothetical protein
MNPEVADRFRQLPIPGDDHPPIADPAQVLAGIEREASQISYGPGHALPRRTLAPGLGANLLLGAQRLGSVFDNSHLVPPGDLHNGLHIRHLAEEVNGH